MTIPTANLRPYLQKFDLTGLFREGLGWDNPPPAPLSVTADGHEFTLTPVAQKRGFLVYRCALDQDGQTPRYPVRSKIENEVTKSTFEHLIIYVDEAESTQIWQWVKRETGKPTVRRELPYHGGAGDNLLQRLQGIAFTLDEEDDLTVGHVSSRVGKVMDVEKVTKRFYERFRTELGAFTEFIEGITNMEDRDWYASLMLNRMMFVYFIQKQGFLADDLDYLRNKLSEVRGTYGDGQFQGFYREFLLRLFHEGLGQPKSERDDELKKLLGDVPFLNGGLFDPHELEETYESINIPDDAFERVFEFFDAYRWHLDERPNREDNEINPDVLGYIFEKYVNQKQMGAYYTKEDITGYISRNTIIPFLFDTARKKDTVAFQPDGGVWRLLQENPDRYIYPAVGHGIAWNARDAADPKPLDEPFQLPPEIEAGINNVSQRGGWNVAAPEEHALPTETWREVVARRQRYDELKAKLESGGVTEINDLITLNLDIEQFARDVIAQSEGPDLLRAFWQALRDVSVLDPTCGSGAFLFAALNILEPLYTACLEGMRGFLDDEERLKRHGPGYLNDFKDVLEQLSKHPSERYYILKSIILNNLYGVDIMEEAVEICKLRLFLKLVAQLENVGQIEPLPDIDFNIRASNTLVGFTTVDAVEQAMTVMPNGQHRMLSEEDERTLARINERAEEVSSATTQFRWQQTFGGGSITSEHKSELRDRLRALTDELDLYLAKEYGIDRETDVDAYDAWRKSHQPFHWFAEFHGIMSRGGFDVVIGNPPYVATKSIGYSFGHKQKPQYPDIYAYVLEKSMLVTTPKIGRYGMILPLSISFSRDFGTLRQSVRARGVSWLSSFDNIPAALFAGVSQRCTILLSAMTGQTSFTTRLNRWRAQSRPSLMANISYTAVQSDYEVGSFGFPRLSGQHGEELLRLHSKVADKASASVATPSDSQGILGFSPTARNFISTYLEPPPTLDMKGRTIQDTEPGSSIVLASTELAHAALAATSGMACFWYWLTRGDGFHVTNSFLSEYLAPLTGLPSEYQHKLELIGGLLHESRNAALVFKKNAGKYVGNFNYTRLEALTLRADLVFLAGLGANWTDAENLLAFTALVRAINEAAGEKNIPEQIKAKFPAVDPMKISSDGRLRDIDEWLSRVFGIPSRRTLEQYNLAKGATYHAIP